jgi:hypothetical protein
LRCAEGDMPGLFLGFKKNPQVRFKLGQDRKRFLSDHRNADLEERSFATNVRMMARQITSHDLERPFRALVSLVCTPRALPWAAIRRAVGAENENTAGDESYAPKVQTNVAKGNALDCRSRCLHESWTYHWTGT